MIGRLKGKAALVMGAGSVSPGWGNGKAAAVLFAREGAKVYCVDVNEAAARETAELILGEGGDAGRGNADVADAEDVARVFSSCVDRFGHIHELHNNVGIVDAGEDAQRGPRGVRQEETTEVDGPIGRSRPG